MRKVQVAILISGRGSNMEALVKSSLNGTLENVCHIALVIANKATAGGIQVAESYNVPVAVVESKGKGREEFEKEVCDITAEKEINLICLAGFERILSPYIISKYAGRIVNIHPADTNEFKGLHGYEWAFKSGKRQTKVTVHFVDEGVDTGSIIEQKEVDLTGCNSLDEVEKRGLAIEHRLYPEALAKVCNAMLNKI
jgi:phosphoribosylglycinamide formyltransferase 1